MTSSTSLQACFLRASLLAVLLLVLLEAPGAAAFTSTCRPLPTPTDCEFGLTRDFCGRLVCAKGPGERCGGPSNILGRCGEGMFCKCERCTGCSLITLKCDLSELSSVCA